MLRCLPPSIMAPCRGGHTRRKKLRHTHFNEAAFLDRTKSALACEKATDFVGDHSITGPESDFTPAKALTGHERYEHHLLRFSRIRIVRLALTPQALAARLEALMFRCDMLCICLSERK